MRHVLGIIILVASVAYVRWDTKRTGMHHANFWIVGVALFPLLLILYWIRRYQFLSGSALSKRQIRDVIKRRRSRARIRKADQERRDWENQKRKQRLEDPVRMEAEAENVRRDKEKMKASLEQQLSRQQELRQKRIGLTNASRGR